MDNLDLALSIIREQHGIPDPIEIISSHTPPSVNKAYRNLNELGRVGRAKTATYRSWEVAFGYDVNAAMRGKKPIRGPYTMRITLSQASRHKRSDISNRAKVVEDALQAHGVIEDDRFCESLTICWADSPHPLRIGIWPA